MSVRERWARIWPAVEHFVAHNVLHLDDTPHRIGMGVFLGFLVGLSPTLGLQMVIYFGLAAVLRANKISGLGPIWVTNPLTAVPIYYMNWRLGGFLMTGQLQTSPESRAAIARLIEGPAGEDSSFFERLLSTEFWSAAWSAFGRIGAELWVGSLFVGAVSGVLGYWATRRAVASYRRRAAGTAPTSASAR
jgi:hypothetical protein